MGWQEFAWSRLLNPAAGSLIVLTVGCLAARFCRQPVRRARIVVLTILGAIAAPCLGALPLTPRWSAGLLSPTPRAANPQNVIAAPSATTATNVSPFSQPPTIFASESANSPPATKPADVKASAATGLKPAQPSRSATPPVATLILAAYAAGAVGFAAWWAFGQLLLWRITRSARPAPQSVRDTR
jgi:hypothetical protein